MTDSNALIDADIIISLAQKDLADGGGTANLDTILANNDNAVTSNFVRFEITSPGKPATPIVKAWLEKAIANGKLRVEAPPNTSLKLGGKGAGERSLLELSKTTFRGDRNTIVSNNTKDVFSSGFMNELPSNSRVITAALFHNDTLLDGNMIVGRYRSVVDAYRNSQGYIRPGFIPFDGTAVTIDPFGSAMAIAGYARNSIRSPDGVSLVVEQFIGPFPHTFTVGPNGRLIRHSLAGILQGLEPQSFNRSLGNDNPLIDISVNPSDTGNKFLDVMKNSRVLQSAGIVGNVIALALTVDEINTLINKGDSASLAQAESLITQQFGSFLGAVGANIAVTAMADALALESDSSIAGGIAFVLTQGGCCLFWQSMG